MAVKSIKETIRTALRGYNVGSVAVEQLAYALERREQKLLQELEDTLAELGRKTIARATANLSAPPEPASTKPSPERQPARDQSEDRKLPNFFVIGVDSPQDHPGRILYCVWHRALNHRVSVWFESAWAASKAADGFNQGNVLGVPSSTIDAPVVGKAIMSDSRARELFNV